MADACVAARLTSVPCRPRFTRARGVERILRFGFELARTRRRQLTMITKSNAQRYAYVLWDDVLDDIAGEYADIKIDKQHADAAAMNLVRRPETFDVVVASNLFGDILTDLAGTIAGGLGLRPAPTRIPSANFPACSSRCTARPPISPVEELQTRSRPR